MLTKTLLTDGITRPTFNRGASIVDPVDHARGHILFDGHTGGILDEKNAQIPIHPASIAKLMTFSIVLDLVKQGRLDLNDEITISARAKKIHAPYTKLDTVTIQHALAYGMVASFNDIATALAEHIGRTEWRFCHEYMNPKAKQLDMQSTEFWSASGLVTPADLRHTKELPASVSSAHDIKKLILHILHDHPEMLDYSAQLAVMVNGREWKNSNPLVRQSGTNVDGLKTGTLQRAGYHLIATSVENGRRVVAVTLGNEDDIERTEHAERLLKYGHTIQELSLDFVECPHAVNHG